jgi:hypothetical protein
MTLEVFPRNCQVPALLAYKSSICKGSHGHEFVARNTVRAANCGLYHRLLFGDRVCVGDVTRSSSTKPRRSRGLHAYGIDCLLGGSLHGLGS